MSTISSYARARGREWMHAHRAELEIYCLGTVYVVSSALARFVVATAFLLSWQRRPYFVCESLDDALAWARKRIRESNPRGTS
jgi:hypothetical protein